VDVCVLPGAGKGYRDRRAEAQSRRYYGGASDAIEPPHETILILHIAYYQ